MPAYIEAHELNIYVCHRPFLSEMRNAIAIGIIKWWSASRKIPIYYYARW